MIIYFATCVNCQVVLQWSEEQFFGINDEPICKYCGDRKWELHGTSFDL